MRIKATQTVLVLALLTLVTGMAGAQTWQTVYETDFSSDPGWTTNNAARYYWDAGSQTYFADTYTNSGEYATTEINYSGESFRLTFDVKPVRGSSETGDVNIGLLGPTRLSNSSNTEERIYLMIGGYGGVIYLTGHNSGGEYIYSGAGSGLMLNNAWHHVEITYDSESLELSLDVTRGGSSVLSWQITMGYGFSSSLSHLGVSMVGSWVTSNRHETANIDNVNLAVGEKCGSSILVYATTDHPNEPYGRASFNDLSDVLYNHNVTIADRITLPAITPEVLSGFDQFWLMSTDLSYLAHFSQQEVDAIMAFRENGGGLYIAADDGPSGHNYQDDANQISIPLGVEFDGTISRGGSACFGVTTTPHPVTLLVDELYGTTNEGEMHVQPPNVVVATQGGNPVTAVRDDGLGRVVFDGSFVRAMNFAVQMCDDSIYYNSIASWLRCGSTVQVALDIKPGSCPNPLNINRVRNPDAYETEPANSNTMAGKRNPFIEPGETERPASKAVVPVAILGTADFDVTQIDYSTVQLEGIAPVRWAMADVGTPVGPDPTECECTESGGDGFVDLTLKFDRAALIAALGEVENGDILSLTFTGQLLDGTEIEGSDCVVIRDGGKSDESSTDEVNPTEFGLDVNYPNPFNPVTAISFGLPEASHVRLEIFNVQGQKVTTLVNELLQAGRHTVEWDGSDLASGLYLYRLEAGDFVATKKMMLLK